MHPEQDRVLTIRENARLQGFPDYYKLFGPVKERCALETLHWSNDLIPPFQTSNSIKVIIPWEIRLNCVAITCFGSLVSLLFWSFWLVCSFGELFGFLFPLSLITVLADFIVSCFISILFVSFHLLMISCFLFKKTYFVP